MSKDALKTLQDLSAELASMRNVTVSFPGLSTENEEKAVRLAEGGRDFFAVNAQAEARFASAMQSKADSDPEDIEADELLRAGAEAFRDLVVERFEAGGKDVSVKPLKPSTIRSKGSSKVGIDSGALLQNLKAAKPLVRKT